MTGLESTSDIGKNSRLYRKLGSYRGKRTRVRSNKENFRKLKESKDYDRDF